MIICVNIFAEICQEWGVLYGSTLGMIGIHDWRFGGLGHPYDDTMICVKTEVSFIGVLGG